MFSQWVHIYSTHSHSLPPTHTALRMSKGGLPLVISKVIFGILELFPLDTNDCAAMAPCTWRSREGTRVKPCLCESVLLAAPKCGTGWGCAAVSSSHTEGSLSSFSAIPMKPWLWNCPYSRDRERKTDTHQHYIRTWTNTNHCVFHTDTHARMLWMGAAARLPACLCGVMTSLFASICAGRQATIASCLSEASRARGGGSAATRLPWRCEHGW